MYAIHFGVYPHAGENEVQVHGHSDPNVEHEIELPDAMHESGISKAYVSGSWGCWGPDDQSTDGDNSLHVVFYSDRCEAGLIANLHGILTITLPELDAIHGRVIDYAIVSSDDNWSEQSRIAIIGGRPHVVLYEGRVVDSTYHNPAELDLEE